MAAMGGSEKVIMAQATKSLQAKQICKGAGYQYQLSCHTFEGIFRPSSPCKHTVIFEYPSHNFVGITITFQEYKN